MLTADELAGVVDLFGALARHELSEALSELAYRRGEEFSTPGAAIEDAIDAFELVVFVSASDETLLAPGPAAFPTLPDRAEDLPHILEIEPRSIDRETVGRAAEERLRSDAARAIADGDEARVAELLDVTYDLEAWAPVDLEDARNRLDEAIDGTN